MKNRRAGTMRDFIHDLQGVIDRYQAGIDRAGTRASLGAYARQLAENGKIRINGSPEYSIHGDHPSITNDDAKYTAYKGDIRMGTWWGDIDDAIECVLSDIIGERVYIANGTYPDQCPVCMDLPPGTECMHYVDGERWTVTDRDYLNPGKKG